MRKAELGLQVKVNRCWHSEREITPLSYRATAVLAPTGNPHIDPRNNADAPAPDMPNILRIIRENNRPRASPAPLDTSSSDITMKGNREGITVLAQRVSPRPMYSTAASELRRIRMKQKVDMSQNPACPAVGREARLEVEGDRMERALWVMTVTLPAYGLVNRLYAGGHET
jgi:hypothetical protein